MRRDSFFFCNAPLARRVQFSPALLCSASFDSRVRSTPFPLFFGIIFPPVCSGTDSLSTRLFAPMHKHPRRLRRAAVSLILYGSGVTKFSEMSKRAFKVS
jgi:hypothetical protein